MNAKKSFFFTVYLCVCLLQAIIGGNTFKNPILPGMNPDPSICRVGDDFYLVTSTFEYFPGLPIYHSKDLVHWKLIGHALSTPTANPLMGCDASGGQYAPTIRYHDGLFYVIGTNYGGRGSRGISYVTAKDPAGPWSEPIWTGDWYVDPSLEFIDNTCYYLSPDNAGSFLLGIMNPKTGKFTEPLRLIAAGLGGSSPEGPHLYKVGDYYYIMSAEGGTGYQHREVIQRSKSPWGPYEPSPNNPVLSNMSVPTHPFQAIGHADLVQLKDGSWWVVTLGIRPRNGKYQHLGRETFLAPVTWDENGWSKVGEKGIVEEEYPVPNLPEHKWEKDPVRDDFNSPGLNLHWNFIRNPYSGDWSLTERPGYLRLKGSKINFEGNDSPAFIGRRQTAFDIIASTKISFVPVSENEEAGLVVRANDKNHYDLLITRNEGKRVIMFRKYLKDKIADINYREISDGDIILHIGATDSEYKFWVQEEGKDVTLVETASTKDVSNEVVGGFTGVFIGMYASGNGKANTNPADFDWFDFEEKKGLKDIYKDFFRFGTILNGTTSNDREMKDLVLREFNSITPENELKPDATMLQSGSTDEDIKVQLNTGARRILQFCQDNNIPVRGHTLVWHSQTPAWFFRANMTNSGDLADAPTMNKRMESYIKNLFALIKNDFPNLNLYAYDIVNEAFKNDGGGLREAGTGTGQSPWTQIYGNDQFIINAFKYARMYAPANCKLFYNEYNEYIATKRDAIYNLAMKLKAENLIDGIGMQAHLDMGYPDANLFGQAVAKFASTGLEVQITEMDITTSTGDFVAQGQKYRDIMKKVLEHKNSVTAFVVWGIQDNQSWRSDRNPLLFDADGNGKPAYDELCFLARGTDTGSSISVPEIRSDNSLKAWTNGDMLHITGIAKGNLWRVYTVTGILLHQDIAMGNTTTATLNLPPGVYIVRTEEGTVKVVR